MPSSTTPKYWFPAKRYGWGWGRPSTWQGWVVLLVYFALVLGGIPLLLSTRGQLVYIAYVVLLTAVLNTICWLTGEHPRWRWGGRDCTVGMNRVEQAIPKRPPYGYLAVFWLLMTTEILLVFPWFVLSSLSIMAFDAPGSEKQILNWLFFLFIWSYPVWIWISFPIARRRFTNYLYRSAIAWLLVPLVYVSIVSFFFLVLPTLHAKPYA